MEGGPFMGEDCVSRLGSVLISRGDKGAGELCDGLMGEDDSGEGRVGRCGDEKSKSNIGIVASISSTFFSMQELSKMIYELVR